jgi:uncharacterized protein with PIN domain
MLRMLFNVRLLSESTNRKGASMKCIADEMIENLAVILRRDGVDCRTVHECIGGSRVKTRKIHDAEVRRFMNERKARGEDFTLITSDSHSWEQVKSDGLPAIYVQHVLREYVLNQAGRSK